MDKENKTIQTKIGLFTFVPYDQCDTTINSEVLGKSFSFTVEAGDESELNEILPKAEKVITSIKDLDEKAKSFAAEELLETHNESWRVEGSDEIDKAEFSKRIFLNSIFMYRDGFFGMEYEDGDLFWGHRIHVDFNTDLEPESADI